MAAIGRLLKYIQPCSVAAIAAKLPPKQEYGFCVAIGRFLSFSMYGEWPLPFFASGGNGSFADLGRDFGNQRPSGAASLQAVHAIS